MTKKARSAATAGAFSNCRVIGDQSVQHPKESNRDMSLDDQNTKSRHLPENAAPSSVRPGAPHNGKIPSEFETANFVVYPAHGVGQILSIEEQTVAGASLEFFVIYFAKSKMTLRAPTRKAANVGMRKLSGPDVIKRVRSTLSQRPNKPRGNWSRLAQEYSSKINSGDIIALAEVMRDLYRPPQNS